MTRWTIALLLALGAYACASVPPAPPPPQEPSFDEKMSWILRLEDSRILRDPAPQVVAPPEPVSGRSRVVAPVVLPPVPDLVRLLTDKEARIRRRAALAAGRAGDPAAIPGLIAILSDTDPEVRQMAAFSLGLLGDARARTALTTALADPAPMVKGSAAEALGLIGDVADAPAIARMAFELLSAGAVARPPSEDLDAARDTSAAAFRLAVFALARLKTYDALAGATLDERGHVRVRWWPVAYAFQRLEDPRALPVLLDLLKDPEIYTRAFAAKGLGAMKDRTAAEALVALVGDPDRPVAIEAIRSLGRLGTLGAAQLTALIRSRTAEPHLRLEAVSAIGGVRGDGVFDALIDLLGDPSPPIRAAAIRSLAQQDPEAFIAVLSGLDQDSHWSVRAALASALGGLTPEAGLPRLRAMLADPEPKVLPSVLASIAKLAPPDAGSIMIEQLQSPDPVVRASAANALGTLKPPAGTVALAEAYERSRADTTYVARAAVLGALKAYGSAAATPLLTDALGDKDWALRVRAATLLAELDPATDARSRIRPVPLNQPEAWYARAEVTNPAVSTQAFIETDRGTIQIELAVLDAPVTVDNFVTLARRGFFDGIPIHRVVPDFVIQGGDPRGDGEGGPGFTIRDEINQRPYLRGTVGMALDWADTGGSQFFITHSPQPHLDGRYTVFGRVLAGMDVVDRIEQWDVIRRVRVWDGSTN